MGQNAHDYNKQQTAYMHASHTSDTQVIYMFNTQCALHSYA